MDKVKIKIIGVGGSGGNTISRMAKEKISGIDLIAINTDIQDLKKSKAEIKIRIGKKTTQGLGAGMNPEIGRLACLEQKKEIAEVLKDAHLAFITYGLGGGTGTGAGPVVAEIAKNLNVLTVAIVTLPFSFEGQTRMKIAKEGREQLREKVDSLICIKNDKLLEIFDPKTPINLAFWHCDQILREAVKGISDLIVSPGIINVNFSDIKSILKNSGTTLFSVGVGRGEGRLKKALEKVLYSPLLELSPKGARGILFNVIGNNISLSEVEEIGKMILKEINPRAKIVFGAKEEEKGDELKIILIATGF